MSAAFQEGAQSRREDGDVLASIRRMIAHGADSGAAPPLRLQSSDALNAVDATGSRAVALRWAARGEAPQPQRLGVAPVGESVSDASDPTPAEMPPEVAVPDPVALPVAAVRGPAHAPLDVPAPALADPVEPFAEKPAELVQGTQPAEVPPQHEDVAMNPVEQTRTANTGGESIIGTIFRDVLRQELSGQGSDLLRRQLRDMILQEVIQAISTPARSA